MRFLFCVVFTIAIILSIGCGNDPESEIQAKLPVNRLLQLKSAPAEVDGQTVQEDHMITYEPQHASEGPHDSGLREWKPYVTGGVFVMRDTSPECLYIDVHNERSEDKVQVKDFNKDTYIDKMYFDLPDHLKAKTIDDLG